VSLLSILRLFHGFREAVQACLQRKLPIFRRRDTMPKASSTKPATERRSFYRANRLRITTAKPPKAIASVLSVPGSGKEEPPEGWSLTVISLRMKLPFPARPGPPSGRLALLSVSSRMPVIAVRFVHAVTV
jgi:hypothetical protein